MNRGDTFVGEARTADFRAWKLCAIDEQNACAVAGAAVLTVSRSGECSGRTRRACADHRDIELERREE
jgi:hypothetical protein